MRFAPLHPDTLSPRQREVVNAFHPQRQGGLAGPFHALLHSPEIAERVKLLGEELRFHLRVPERLRALAILVSASTYRSDEAARFAALPEIRDSGLSAAKAAALGAGRRPEDLTADEQATFEFSWQLTRGGRVNTSCFETLAAQVGKEVCLELVVLCGYVLFLSRLMNITQTGLHIQ